MINSKKVLAIIPARGGSKGVPRKNIKDMNGKPLIAWTIEEAKKSKYLDRIILSTEDLEIMSVARQIGCDVPFLRPNSLAQDSTPGIDPILHALEQISDFDYVVLLQPTSPLRIVDDIDGCIEAFIKSNMPSCVTVTEADKSPYWMYHLTSRNFLQPILSSEDQYLRRQDIPVAYALNGAVYVAEIEWLKKNKTFLTKETMAHIMPKERSFDIDTELDFFICEQLLNKRKC